MVANNKKFMGIDKGAVISWIDPHTRIGTVLKVNRTCYQVVLRYFEGIELTWEEVRHFNDANIRNIQQLEKHFGVPCPLCESVKDRLCAKLVMDRLLGRDNEKTA